MNDQPQNDQPQDDQPMNDQPHETSAAPEGHATISDDNPSRGPLGMRGRGRWIAAGGLAVLLAVGIGAGAYAIGANADEGTNQVSYGDGREDHGDRDRSNDAAADEQLLTGTDLAEVTAAVEAEYPGSTILEAETDSDGVFEAHIVTSNGDHVTVELDESFAITGTETDR